MLTAREESRQTNRVFPDANRSHFILDVQRTMTALPAVRSAG